MTNDELAGVDELVGRLELGDLAAIPEAVTALQSLTATAREAEALRAENARLQARADAARREALEQAAKVKPEKSETFAYQQAGYADGWDAAIKAYRSALKDLAHG